MRTRLGRLLGAAATVCVLVAASAALPAEAANPTSISLHVQDAAGEPLSNVYVLASNGERTIELGDTDENGNIVKATGARGDRISAGEWDLDLQDQDVWRFFDNERMAPSFESMSVSAGIENTRDPITMQAGGHFIGRATAPSGRPVRNVEPELYDDEYDDYPIANRTDKDGRFDAGALRTAFFDLFMWVGEEDNVQDTNIVVTIDEPGQVVSKDIKNVKVLCSSRLDVSSPSTGRVKIAIRSTGQEYGLTRPGGKVVLYRNGKAIRNISWKNRSYWSTTLAHQTQGKKFTYKAVHTDGDCLKWFATKTVTVKKK